MGLHKPKTFAMIIITFPTNKDCYTYTNIKLPCVGKCMMMLTKASEASVHAATGLNDCCHRLAGALTYSMPP